MNASIKIYFTCLVMFVLLPLSRKLKSQDLPDPSLSLKYYFPIQTFNANIPPPKAVLGFEIGQQHIDHTSAMLYYKQLSKASDRVKMIPYGQTVEKRKLSLLVITSPENHKNLEAIRTRKIPKLIVWLGYSIHGNEASGANAAPLFAYYLAASKGADVQAQLKDMVIIIDPMINPDGINRFASWANSRKSQQLHDHPLDLEHAEGWPNGRTNHYWFDLNRDWLPLVMPSSKFRMEQYHYWRPHILTDHHEMSTNSTFFFQPGEPSRNNVLTPKQNHKLTKKLGDYHAKYLDKIGSLYFSQERYDDFYIGKGSTYPDITGGIGILFEQASARGHLNSGNHGQVSFPFAIRNQLTVSLSTIDGAYHLKEELLNYQKDFENISVLLQKEKKIGYAFEKRNDDDAFESFLRFLKRHQVKYYKSKSKNTNGFIVPYDQRQFRFIKSIFEPKTSFSDSLFYDVSSWPMHEAYHVQMTALLKGKDEKVLSALDLNKPFPDLEKDEVSPFEKQDNNAIAFVIKWGDLKTATLTYQLLKADVKMRAANEQFTIEGKKYKQGTLIIPLKIQGQLEQSKIEKYLLDSGLSNEKITLVRTGKADQGSFLGSDNFRKMELPKIVVLVEGNVNPYEAGEVWHYLDVRLKIPFLMLPVRKFPSLNLYDFNTLILPDGNYEDLSIYVKKIKAWTVNGGKVIGIKRGGQWIAQSISDDGIYDKTKQKADTTLHVPYRLAARQHGAILIRGAAFQTKLDLTHPLCYGFEDDQLAVFRNHRRVMTRRKDDFSNPMIYTANPLLAGYLPKRNLPNIKDSPAIFAKRFGKGKVICFVDNPLFRGYWWGSQKVFTNAIFQY